MMATKGQLSEEIVLHVATDLGLDVSRLQKEAASQEVEAALKRNNNLAEALAIKGTPAFVIGDELIPGLVEIDSLKEKIAALRKPS
jgi:protein-disulfide isomerase